MICIPCAGIGLAAPIKAALHYGYLITTLYQITVPSHCNKPPYQEPPSLLFLVSFIGNFSDVTIFIAVRKWFLHGVAQTINDMVADLKSMTNGKQIILAD